MTPAQLIRLAEAIYGPELGDDWKSQMAEDLGVDRRTVHRWLDGTRGIPEGIEKDLRFIASERAEEFAAQPALAKVRARELKAIAEGKS